MRACRSAPLRMWSLPHVRVIDVLAERKLEVTHHLQECAAMREMDLQECAAIRETDLQECAAMRETDLQECAAMRETDLSEHVVNVAASPSAAARNLEWPCKKIARLARLLSKCGALAVFFLRKF